ncbi:MAG TPA: type VI secretion system baseplate subunit TssE [Sulfurovum sp.]|nr:type VI secretion system baseplate subunit TssE [Sulfurovum sp.]
MFEGSLFEKLTGSLSDIKHNEEDSLYTSIANNLSNIFSTNVGSAEACMDYGKPELNDINLGLEESLTNISESFTASILKYEPRLHDVKVNASANTHNLSKIHISITGYMQTNNQDHKVEYTAFIVGDGIIEVKK